MIVRLPDGTYQVRSRKGKPLGTYSSRKKAEERLQQIEMFKHMKRKKASEDNELIKKAAGLEDLLDRLTKERHFTERVKLCKESFPLLGQGSSRIAFALPDGKVLKLAKNAKGIAQNEVEDDGFLQSSELIPEIYRVCPQHHYLVTEQAERISPSQFKALTGIDWKGFCDAIFWWSRWRNGNNAIKPAQYDTIKENPFYNEIQNLLGSMDMAVGDLMRISSYGAIRGKIYLIDSGGTEDLIKRMYSRK